MKVIDTTSMSVLDVFEQVLFAVRKVTENTGGDQSNFSKLVQLKHAHPELPVIPVSDIWRGSWDKASIRDIMMREDAPIFFDAKASKSEMRSVLIDCGTYDKEDVLQMSENTLRHAYETLPWEKAIIAQIVGWKQGKEG